MYHINPIQNMEEQPKIKASLMVDLLSDMVRAKV